MYDECDIKSDWKTKLYIHYIFWNIFLELKCGIFFFFLNETSMLVFAEL